jgi:hypothetical protein
MDRMRNEAIIVTGSRDRWPRSTRNRPAPSAPAGERARQTKIASD